MKDIKLIALDMDGTLLNDNKEVPKRNREAIEKALGQGVHIVLSTGRGFDLSYPYAVDLGLPSYLIAANGAEIWTIDKELLRKRPLPKGMIEKLYNLGTQVGAGMWMISTEGAFQEELPKDFENYEWLKFGCYSKDKQALDILIKEFSKYDLELANSLPMNIEVNAKGVTKANALEFLCDRIGITMNEVMACGDSLNDMKMIQASRVGVAMGNAQETIQQVADYKTASNNDSGVAEAIERFVL